MKPGPSGVRLKTLRERAGISQRELGHLAGVSPGYPGHLESGRVQQPSVDLAQKLAGALGCTPEHLLLGSGKPPNDAHIRAALKAAGFDPAAKGAA